MKLAVCLLVIGVMVPLVTDMVRDAQDGMDILTVEGEALGIRDAVYRTYHGGIGTSTTVDVSLPPGRSIAIGGEERYSLRLLIDGEEVGRLYLDDPPVPVLGPGTVLNGGDVVMLRAVTVDGVYGVAVTA